MQPEWLAAFRTDPSHLFDLAVRGAYFFGPLNATDPADLLQGWARAGMLDTSALDKAAASWVERHWLSEVAPEEVIAMRVAWMRVAALTEALDGLTRTARAFWERWPTREVALAPLSVSRVYDPLGRYLSAVAWCQRRLDVGDAAVESLRRDWWDYVNVVPGIRWYHGRYGVAGIIGAPTADPDQQGGFRVDVAEAVAEFGAALYRLVGRGVLEERTAKDEFFAVAYQAARRFPFPDKWTVYWAEALIESLSAARRPGRPVRATFMPDEWIRELDPRIGKRNPHAVKQILGAKLGGEGLLRPGTSRKPGPNPAGRSKRVLDADIGGKGGIRSEIFRKPDPSWADRSGAIRGAIERAARAPERLGEEIRRAKLFLEEQRGYTRATGDTEYLTKSLNNFSPVALKVGEYDLALEWAAEARDWEGWNDVSWNNYVVAQIHTEGLEAALRTALDAKERFPNSTAVLNEHATLLRHLGRLEEAEYAYRDALGAVSDLAHYLASGLWSVLYHLGVRDGAAFRFEEALEVVNDVLRSTPDYVPAHSMTGHLLLRLGRAAEAARAYETALDLDLTDEQRDDFRYGCARALAALGETDDAWAHAHETLYTYKRRGKMEKQAEVRFLNLLGDLARSRQDRKTAKEAYRDAIVVNPDDAYAHSRLALTLFREYQYGGADVATLMEARSEVDLALRIGAQGTGGASFAEKLRNEIEEVVRRHSAPKASEEAPESGASVDPGKQEVPEVRSPRDASAKEAAGDEYVSGGDGIAARYASGNKLEGLVDLQFEDIAVASPEIWPSEGLEGEIERARAASASGGRRRSGDTNDSTLPRVEAPAEVPSVPQMMGEAELREARFHLQMARQLRLWALESEERNRRAEEKGEFLRRAGEEIKAAERADPVRRLVEVTLLHLDRGDWQEANAMIEREGRPLEGSTLVAYTRGRVDRAVAVREQRPLNLNEVDSAYGDWSLLLQVDPQLQPLALLGRARALLAHVDGEVRAGEVTDSLVKLRTWCQSVEGERTRQGALSHESKVSFNWWWAAKVSEVITPIHDRNDIRDVEHHLQTASRKLDRLEEDYAFRLGT